MPRSQTSPLKSFLAHGTHDIGSEALDPSIQDDLRIGMYEGVGTLCSLTLGLAGYRLLASAVDDPNIERLAYNYAASMSLSLAMVFSIFMSVSWCLFNPAVTLALFQVGAIRLPRLVFCVIFQLLGAVIASAILGRNTDTLPILTSSTLGYGTISSAFLEAAGTGFLVLALLATHERYAASRIAPLLVGAAFSFIQLFTSSYMNPAFAFGHSVFNGGFKSNHWVFWVGPIIGSVVAATLYKIEMGDVDYDRFNGGLLPVFMSDDEKMQQVPSSPKLAAARSDIENLQNDVVGPVLVQDADKSVLSAVGGSL